MNTAFIPARGGSKGIPMKNIRDFCGKPLIFWTIEALMKSKLIDRIIVATDNLEIEQKVGINFATIEVYSRNEENACDDSTTESVILEFIEQDELIEDYDVFILCQCTNPFVKGKDYDDAIILFNMFCNGIVSVVEFPRFMWFREGQYLVPDYNTRNRPRRQDLYRYLENGAFYISDVEHIKTDKCRISHPVGGYKMPWYSFIELDEEKDWELAEWLFEKYHLKEIT